MVSIDGFVKSPSAALPACALHADRRCIPRRYSVTRSTLTPRDLRALHLELFTVPSDF